MAAHCESHRNALASARLVVDAAPDEGFTVGIIMSERSPLAEVIAETEKKVRTFLYEIAEGGTNYRSLHNLTEQIEHQYHGRVVIELIQNAHDALAKGRQPGRVELVLKPDEGEFGTLYVANDGACFTRSNFGSLSQLGQSDKNPEESIGNKGIGFRSVLEVTSTPQIFSRLAADSATFDGYCFGFTPAYIREIAGPVMALLRGESSSQQLVDWDETLRTKFRAAVVSQGGESWLHSELRYLSPYLLPRPLDPVHAEVAVRDFERRGFATVIRLPLKAKSATDLLREKFGELNSHTLLFLDRANSLVIDDGTIRRELTRGSEARSGSCHRGEDVVITEPADGAPQRYWVWQWELVVADAPQEVRDALASMPGKWPQLTRTSVSLAVQLSNEARPGALSIFLPTLRASGCGAHINAPFFGDMSRTDIPFNNAYNAFLLRKAAVLAVQVIQDELTGQGIDEARAIIDLLVPYGPDRDASARWKTVSFGAALEQGVDFDEVNWFLSDQGWKTIGETSLIPELSGSTVITRDALRAHATFAAFVAGLDSRADALHALFDAHGMPALPIHSDLAETVEALARFLRQRDANWREFWCDAERLFSGNNSPLVGKQVLLGSDGELHASGENCTVFFSAGQGAQQGEDIGSAETVIPQSLSGYVAFLSDRIFVGDERGNNSSSQVRKFLEGKLVSRYGVEDIFQKVLIKRIPPLPIPLDDSRSDLCRDILLWGLKLMAHLVERGRGSKSPRLLRELPAPCRGGWFKLGECSFGAGWPGTQGDLLVRYLKGLPRDEGKRDRDRLLLSPSNSFWGREGLTHQRLLRFAGVFDGLRLSAVNPKDWTSTFQGCRYIFPCPTAPPPGVNVLFWEQFRQHIAANVKPYYEGWFPYEVQKLYIFPGFSAYEELDGDTRQDLMSLVFGSLGAWEEDWKILIFEKKVGNSDSRSAESPLFFALRTWCWLGLPSAEGVEWFRPSERWHVSAPALAQAWQFEHLRPLPARLAHRLDNDRSLAEALQALGMPRYDPETPSPSTRLLVDLASAVEGCDIRDWNVFLGQVRAAWDAFLPAPETKFPPLLIVRRGGGHLTAEHPTVDRPIYLPDSPRFFAALEQFALPVLAIEPKNARRLAERFVHHYGSAVHLTSSLKLVPLVPDTPWVSSGEQRLPETSLEQLAPLLLALAAFAGTQPSNTSSKRFQRQMADLRAAKVSWVPGLKVALFHGANKMADPAADALWLKVEGVLLVTERCYTHPSLLAEALSQLLDREDLEWQIKLLLQGLSNLEVGTEEQERALRLVRLSPEHLQEVREHWRGDLGQVMRMLLPLLALVRPDVDLGEIVELKSDSELEKILDALNDQRFRGSDLLKLCRTSADLFSFGKSAWRQFGEPLQMDAWNAFLEQSGDPILVNREAASEFRRHLSSALPLLRSLVCTILRRSNSGQSFTTFQEELNAVACPPEYEKEFWEVDFSRALATTIPLFERWQAFDAEIEAVKVASSREALEEQLRSVRVDTSFDPLETARRNRELLRNSLNQLQQIGLAWALANNHRDPSTWESRTEGYMATLTVELASQGYLKVWSESDVFGLLRVLPRDTDSECFWDHVTQAQSFQDLVAKLGLAADALSQAKERLRTFKEDARRRSRLVQVGGKEFDSSEDNLSRLYDHIQLVFPDDRLAALTGIDLRSPDGLALITRDSTPGRKDGRSRTQTRVKRASKAMEALIGLAGEIHAYRMLKSRYNARQESWISSNGNIVFPENQYDDGRGCDFEIAIGDRVYCVEVKASEGEDEYFSLGSSEIRLAVEIARKSRPHRKSVFTILHVTRALSDQPEFKLLPNPYDPRYQSFFLLDGADVRVRYKT